MKHVIQLPTQRITARAAHLPTVDKRVMPHAANHEASRLVDKGYTSIKFWPKEAR
ncbi:hypothetical protein [Streptococcus salivarius]|uniref:hypothetical protein n=1 Tax=Streptococcus salivarius TaxID=1304 RepID=UPI00159BD7C2|nr:hypothetical protein [Streptococcus salivarius]